MKNFAILAAAIGLAIMLAFDLLVFLVVWRLYPSNHWGYDIRWGYMICVLCVASGLFALFSTVSRWWWLTSTGTGIGLVSGILIYVLRAYNVLLPYEEWLKRGMPPLGG